MQEPYLPPVEPPKQRNNTLIWILVLGSLGLCLLLVIPIGAAILFPVFAQANQAAKKTATLVNAKQLSIGVMMYAVDFDDTFPRADTWSDVAIAYVKDEAHFSAPVDTASPGGYDFAFAKGLSGKKLTAIADPNRVAMIFESGTEGKNQAGGKELLPKPGRCSLAGGRRGSAIAMADASAKVVSDEEIGTNSIKFP